MLSALNARKVPVEELMKEGRNDLIGFDKKCLIKPRRMSSEKQSEKSGNKSGFKPSGKSAGKLASKTGNKPAKKKTIRNVHKKK